MQRELLENADYIIEDPDYISQFLLNDFDLNLNKLFTFYLPPAGVKDIGKFVEKNNKLFTEEQIQFAVKKINDDIKEKRLIDGAKYAKIAEDFKHSAIIIPNHTYSYSINNTTYTVNMHSVLFSLYAVYPGRKHNLERYFGPHSTIKWVQHSNSEWMLAKYIVKANNYSNYFSQNKPAKKKFPRIQYKKTAAPIEASEKYRNSDQEIEILNILGKYRGHVQRINKQGFTQKIILMQNAGEFTLEDFLNKNQTLTTQQVLIIGLQLLLAYSKNFKNGILHRNIKPSKIMIEAIEDGKKYAIEIVGWSSAFYIRKSKKEHAISITDENGYGTACYADHEIAAKILEESEDPLTTAKSLAVFNKRLVIELIIDKKKVDYKFMINFVRALAFCEDKVEGKILKTISEENFSKYILPIMNKDTRAAEVIASVVIYLLQTEPDFKDKDLSLIKSFLDEKHDAFKTTLQSDIDDISTKLADNNEKFSTVEYNEKSEIYSLARVLEELLKKTNKEDNKFLRGLAFKFVSKKCKNVNRDYRPTILEAVKTFRSYIKKFDKLNNTQIYALQLNSMQFKSSESLYDNNSYIQPPGYVDLLTLKSLLDENVKIDFLRLKKYQIVFVLNDIRVSADVNTIDDIQKVKKKLQEEGVRVCGFVLVHNNPYRSITENKRVRLTQDNKSITISSIPVKRNSKDDSPNIELPLKTSSTNLLTKSDEEVFVQVDTQEKEEKQIIISEIMEHDVEQNLKKTQSLPISSNPISSSKSQNSKKNTPNDSTGYFNPTISPEDEKQQEKARRAMERKFTINPDKDIKPKSQIKLSLLNFTNTIEKQRTNEKKKNKGHSLFSSTREKGRSKRKSQDLSVRFFKPMEPTEVIVTSDPKNQSPPSSSSPTPVITSPKPGVTFSDK